MRFSWTFLCLRYSVWKLFNISPLPGDSLIITKNVLLKLSCHICDTHVPYVSSSMIIETDALCPSSLGLNLSVCLLLCVTPNASPKWGSPHTLLRWCHRWALFSCLLLHSCSQFLINPFFAPPIHTSALWRTSESAHLCYLLTCHFWGPLDLISLVIGLNMTFPYSAF